MLVGLSELDSGEIQFSQQDKNVKQKLESYEFGYLPEERGLFQENTLIETLVYIARLKGMDKKDAIKTAEQWLEKFDLLARKDDALKTLSKGNQQKVQLISAIIHRPKIAFLDEPFSGLDPINQEKVIKFLEALKAQGTTIILSAHQMSLVEKLADRFLLMNKGKASFYGDIETIRSYSHLGPILQLRFKDAPENEALLGLEGVNDLHNLDENTVKLSLSPTTNIPSLLKRLLDKYEVLSLQSEQPSLHDIYLHAVKESENE